MASITGILVDPGHGVQWRRRKLCTNTAYSHKPFCQSLEPIKLELTNSGGGGWDIELDVRVVVLHMVASVVLSAILILPWLWLKGLPWETMPNRACMCLVTEPLQYL